MRKTTTFLYGKLVLKITEFIEIKKSKEKDDLSNYFTKQNKYEN